MIPKSGNQFSDKIMRHQNMPNAMIRMIRRLRRGFKRVSDGVLGAAAVRLLEGFSHSNPDIMADFGGWAMRKIGPRLKEHKIARDNLVAAFPEKSADEIDTILSGV